MPKISVITITARDLRLSKQVEALSRQTFQDFEWIVVDDKRDEHQIVAPFPFKHIYPKVVRTYTAHNEANNTGLIHAQGELVILMSDYMIYGSGVLAEHWRIYQKYPKSFVASTAIHAGIDTFEVSEIDTKFTKEQDIRRSQVLPQVQYYEVLEPGVYRFPGRRANRGWYGKNDSAPLSAFLDLNGLDELLDGGRYDSDAQMGERFYNYGYRYIFTEHTIAIETDHLGLAKECMKFVPDYHKYIEEYVTSGNIYPGHQHDLKKMREELNHG